MGESAGSYSFDDLEVDIVHQFLPPPPPPPFTAAAAPPPPGVVALLGFEGTDDGVTAQKNANNGSWSVSVPDPRAAHTGGHGLYVEVDKAWRVANLAQLLLPRYVPRAGKETLLHLSFWARAAATQGKTTSPKLVFQDADDNYTPLKQETLPLVADWHMYQVDFSQPTCAARNSGAIPAQFWRNSAQ